MTFKKFAFQLHKILGLTTGVVVFIVALTGCLWVFSEEIEGLYNDYENVPVEDKEILKPSQARRLAQAVFPDKLVHGAAYHGPGKATEVVFYEVEPEFYQSVYLNPYSGEVLHVKEHRSGFFPFILKGHMYLWLPREIGEQVVRISVLLFMLICISGFIIWLPKKRKNLKQRIKFDWKKTTRWKRKNFDLHAILGFYVCILAFILAFTGSVIAYTWFSSAFYKSMGGDKDVTFFIPENISKKSDNTFNEPAIDHLYTLLIEEANEFQELEFHFPHTETASIYVEGFNTDGVFYDNDFRYYDQNTLEEIETNGIYGKYEDAGFADTVMRMNYDIHIGAIGGFAGKLIAFLASLLTASLPVTGILLWYGRTYKKKRR